MMMCVSKNSPELKEKLCLALRNVMGYQKITFGGCFMMIAFFRTEKAETYRREFIIFIGISSDVALLHRLVCAGFHEHMASGFRLINW